MRKSITDEQSPAFQFYAQDWITDPNRMKLSLDEQGAYILLFCHCWRSFKILNDLEILSKMCGCRLQKIEKIFPKIKHLFTEIKEDGIKYLICNQAEEERKEQVKNRKRRSVAGKLGAKIRWKEESLSESK